MALCCQSYISIKARIDQSSISGSRGVSHPSLLIETQLYQHIMKLVHHCVRVLRGFVVGSSTASSVQATYISPWGLLQWQPSVCYSLQSLWSPKWHLWKIYQAIYITLLVLISLKWGRWGRKDAIYWLVYVSFLDVKWKKYLLMETILDQSDGILWNNVNLYFHSCMPLDTHIYVHIHFSR